jgi:hypothetical protein
MIESETICYHCERTGRWRNLPDTLARIFCENLDMCIPVSTCQAVPETCRKCIIADEHLELADIDDLMFCRNVKRYVQPRECWARPAGLP